MVAHELALPTYFAAKKAQIVESIPPLNRTATRAETDDAGRALSIEGDSALRQGMLLTRSATLRSR